MKMKYDSIFTILLYIPYAIYVVKKVLIFSPDSNICDMAIDIFLKKQSVCMVNVIPFVLLQVLIMEYYHRKNSIIRFGKIKTYIIHSVKTLVHQYIKIDLEIIIILIVIFMNATKKFFDLHDLMKMIMLIVIMNILMLVLFNFVFGIYVIFRENKIILLAMIISLFLYGTTKGRWIEFSLIYQYINDFKLYCYFIFRLILIYASSLFIVWGITWKRDI